MNIENGIFMGAVVAAVNVIKLAPANRRLRQFAEEDFRGKAI